MVTVNSTRLFTMATTPGPNPIQSDLHEAVNCLQSTGPIVTILTGSTVCRPSVHRATMDLGARPGFCCQSIDGLETA